MPGPRRSGIFELRHHIFENLVQQVTSTFRSYGLCSAKSRASVDCAV